MSEKPKRRRGKKVGVKLLEDNYVPAASFAFTEVLEIATKRRDSRRNAMEQHIEEELDYGDVTSRLSRIFNVAHAKKNLAEKLLSEAVDHRKKAIAVAKVLQIVPVDLDPYEDDGLDHNPSSEETFGVEPVKRKYGRPQQSTEWSGDAGKVLDSAMWLQKEHLDQLEVEYWRDHYVREIQKCLTMEDCVDLLDEASQKAKELRALIQKGDANDDDQNDRSTQSA